MPPTVGYPSASRTSLMPTGSPQSGPTPAPEAAAASTAAVVDAGTMPVAVVTAHKATETDGGQQELLSPDVLDAALQQLQQDHDADLRRYTALVQSLSDALAAWVGADVVAALTTEVAAPQSADSASTGRAAAVCAAAARTLHGLASHASAVISRACGGAAGASDAGVDAAVLSTGPIVARLDGVSAYVGGKAVEACAAVRDRGPAVPWEAIV